MSIIPNVAPGWPDEQLARQLAAVRVVNSHLPEDPYSESQFEKIYGSSAQGSLEEWLGQLTVNLRSIISTMPDAEGFTVNVGPGGVSVTVTYGPITVTSSRQRGLPVSSAPALCGG